MSLQLREFTSASTPPGMSPQDTQLALPTEPTSVAETGLGMGFLTDLTLKVIYFHGNISAQQISEVTKLPFLGVLDKVLDFLKLEEYIDIVGSDGSFNERGFQYIIMGKGRVKVEEVLMKPKLTLEPDPNSPLKISLKAQDAKGKAYFDPAAGRLLETGMTQTMEMEINAMGQTIEQKIEQTVSMKLRENATKK